MKIGDILDFEGSKAFQGDFANMSYIYEVDSETNTYEKFFNFLEYIFKNYLENGGVYILKCYQDGADGESGDVHLLLSCHDSYFDNRIRRSLKKVTLTPSSISDNYFNEDDKICGFAEIYCHTYVDKSKLGQLRIIDGVNLLTTLDDNLIQINREKRLVNNEFVYTYSRDSYTSEMSYFEIDSIQRIA